MRRSTFLSRAALGALVALAALPATAGSLADLAIVDVATGERLPVYAYGGRHYLPGTPGRRYAVEVRNRTGARILAVVAVDGVNVVSGETATTLQAGYVLEPGQPADIRGWRKNLGEVAAFYFTSVPESYAGRTGRPGNVGVIGVAVFREAAPGPASLDAPAGPRTRQAEDGDRAAAPASANDTGPAAPLAAEEASQERGSRPDSTARDAARARQAQPAARSAPLGTGHGERLASRVERTTFQRATDAPEETLVLYYDSRANLVARGIIPAPRPDRSPVPFPGGFVPDPRG